MPARRDPTASSRFFLRGARCTFFDFVMVESDGGNGILVVGAVSDGLDERGLARVLQSDDGDF